MNKNNKYQNREVPTMNKKTTRGMRALSIVLLLCMCATLAPVSLWAQGAEPSTSVVALGEPKSASSASSEHAAEPASTEPTSDSATSEPTSDSVTSEPTSDSATSEPATTEPTTSTETSESDSAASSDSEAETETPVFEAEAACDALLATTELGQYDAIYELYSEEEIAQFTPEQREALDAHRAALEAAEQPAEEEAEPVEEEPVVMIPYEAVSEEGIHVKALVPEGAFDTEVTFTVRMLEGDSEEYAKALEALTANDLGYTNLVAMDVSFRNDEGEEVEPAKPVEISLVVPETLTSEDPASMALEIIHLKEEENGALTVEQVASSDEGNAVAENDTKVVADFTLESFSTIILGENNRAALGTVTTADTASLGVELSLFDYDTTTINDKGAQGSYFMYTPPSVPPAYNKNGTNDWTGTGGGARLNILKPYLVNSYPRFNTDQTGGTTDDATYLYNPSDTVNQAYTNLNHLFQLQNGYYVYDSGANFATLQSTGNFKVYNQPTTDATSKLGAKFMPFNDLNSDRSISGTKNYHFGMSMRFDMIQPDTVDNKIDINGKPQDMIFEFAGDDDVWVFIDGYLALDLGGKHDPVSGSINFTTGKVTQSRITSNAGAHSGPQTSNLYDLMKQAYEAAPEDQKAKMIDPDTLFQDADANNGNRALKRGSVHEFSFYYLERGAYASTCKIQFNLQPKPTGKQLTVSKEVTNINNSNAVDESFDMLLETNTTASGVFTPFASQSYTLLYTDAAGAQKSETKTTDENGRFTLKHGQKAIFDSDAVLKIHQYRITENGVAEQYDVSFNDTAVTKDSNGTAQSAAFTLSGIAAVTVRNAWNSAYHKTLTIQKLIADNETSDESFTVLVELYNAITQSYQPYKGDYAIGTSTASTPDGRVSLKQNQTVTITKLAPGTKYRVTEQLTAEQQKSFGNPDYAAQTNIAPIGTSGTYESTLPAGKEGEATIAVTITNKLLKGSLRVYKTIADTWTEKLGDPIFTFRIEATSGELKGTVWYRAVRFTKTKTANGLGTLQADVLENLPVGEYQVTELSTQRYSVSGVQLNQATTRGTINNTIATVSVEKGYLHPQVTYTNNRKNDNTLSDTDVAVNRYRWNGTAWEVVPDKDPGEDAPTQA